MAIRGTSLSKDTNTGITREIGSQYDNVKAVAEELEAISRTAANIGAIEEVMANIGVIASVGANIVNIIEVAGAATGINAIGALTTEIQSLYADREVLSSLYTDKITLDALYQSKAAIDSLYADKAVLDSLFADKATLDSLFNDKAALDSLYADKAILDSLYADKTILDRLHTSINNIDRIYTSIDNLDTVHASITNVDITAGISGDVTTVAGDSADVQLLADHIDGTVSTDINLVADHIDGTLSTDITTVATDMTNVNTVAADIANVNTTAGSIANVNTVAANIADVNSVVTNLAEILNVDALAAQVTADRSAIETIYDNFDDRYLGAFGTDPTLDNDGDPLSIGAIYFNTTVNSTKFYNGAAWEDPEATATQAAATATTKASEASTSASEALASENSASISASNAGTSETNAAASEATSVAAANTATTKADEASASAISALGSEQAAAGYMEVSSTNAQTAVTAKEAAETAQTAAELALDEFTDLYLGAKASAPTVDNDGDPLQTGALYWDTVTSKPYAWDGSVWNPVVFDATGAVTAFNGRQGDITLTNGDVTGATGQALDSTGTPTFASVQLSGGTGSQGLISWNADEETLDLIQDGATLQLGQEVQTHCRNNTASTIPNGTVVMSTGTIGASGRITIAPYDGVSDVKYILGITTEDIVADADGKVTHFGKVRNLDTSAFTDGDILYPTTNGGLTSVAPTNGVKNSIAIVVHAAANGTLMVRFSPHNELAMEHGETAYGWGDHSAVGYLTSYTETDPVFTAWDKSTGISITEAQISDFGSYEPANANIQTHISSTANPHGVTAAQVGLGNVDNTSDTDKPVSTAQEARIKEAEANALAFSIALG